MTRTLITIILPLIAPTLIYLGWGYLEWRIKKDKEAGRQKEWQKLPWFKLITAGLILMAVSLFVTGLWGEPYKKGRLYVSPHMENGELIPGHFVDKPEE